MSTAVAVPALVITRTYQASRERIFSAWTDPAQLARWFMPAPGFKPEVQADSHVGGSYRIRMQNPNGSIHTALGQYKELVPPSKLVMSWAWEENDSANGSVLTIELRDLGNSSTELTLTHAQLPTEESRQRHEQGWTGCLYSFGQYADPSHYTGPHPAPATGC